MVENGLFFVIIENLRVSVSIPRCLLARHQEAVQVGVL